MLSYIWQQNELFEQVFAVFRNKLFKVFYFFCFHDDEDLRLKERKLALILKIDAAYGSTF